MNILVFLIRNGENEYHVGLLDINESIDKITVSRLSSVSLFSLIHKLSESADCTFIGMNLRREVLHPLHIELAKAKLPLPSQLQFHWVPPYKLKFDDINWIYNYGMFTDECPTVHEIAKELGIEECNEVVELAKVYFALIGNFNF